MVSTFVHETVEIAARIVASRIAGILEPASQHPIGIIVPGGRSPLSLFDKLTRWDIPWSQVTVLPSDERLVPPGDPERNDLLIRRHLIEPLDCPPRFIPLIRDGEALEGSPEVSEFPWPATVAILGMGSDGHIASLFPGQSHAWRSATRLATGLAPTFPENRLSLSLDTLTTSLRTFILVFGVDKRGTFQEALSDPESDLPVAAFLRDTREPVEVHLTDESPQTLY